MADIATIVTVINAPAPAAASAAPASGGTPFDLILKLINNPAAAPSQNQAAAAPPADPAKPLQPALPVQPQTSLLPENSAAAPQASADPAPASQTNANPQAAPQPAGPAAASQASPDLVPASLTSGDPQAAPQPADPASLQQSPASPEGKSQQGAQQPHREGATTDKSATALSVTPQAIPPLAAFAAMAAATDDPDTRDDDNKAPASDDTRPAPQKSQNPSVTAAAAAPAAIPSAGVISEVLLAQLAPAADDKGDDALAVSVDDKSHSAAGNTQTKTLPNPGMPANASVTETDKLVKTPPAAESTSSAVETAEAPAGGSQKAATKPDLAKDFAPNPSVNQAGPHAASAGSGTPATTVTPPAPAAAAAPTVQAPAASSSQQSPPVVAEIQVSPQHHDSESAATAEKLGLAIAAKSVDGVRHFDIRLDPPDLGRVQVQLTVDGSGKAQANLVVDKPQTLEMLQRDAATLNRTLTDAGLNLPNNGLNFTLREQYRQNDGGGVDKGRSRPLSVMAVVQTDASQSRASLASYAPHSVRLDIRV